jgi:hypothetical protein
MREHSAACVLMTDQPQGSAGHAYVLRATHMACA